MSDYAKKYAKNVTDFYAELIRNCFAQDFAEAFTKLAIPYLAPNEMPVSYIVAGGEEDKGE